MEIVEKIKTNLNPRKALGFDLFMGMVLKLCPKRIAVRNSFVKKK